MRATVAMASGSPSPASGLLPVPARQCHLCRQPEAHRSKDVHTNPCARPWVGARLRATVAMASVPPSPASGLLPVPARQCHLCRQPQAHRSKDVHTNPYARPWVGARLRATVAMASGSPSPASGLLPVPARQCHLCRQPQAHRSKDVHTNPCARPWVGARLRATVAIHGVRRYRLSQSRSGRAGRVAPSAPSPAYAAATWSRSKPRCAPTASHLSISPSPTGFPPTGRQPLHHVFFPMLPRLVGVGHSRAPASSPSACCSRCQRFR